jgi:hypothetical protein
MTTKKTTKKKATKKKATKKKATRKTAKKSAKAPVKGISAEARKALAKAMRKKS